MTEPQLATSHINSRTTSTHYKSKSTNDRPSLSILVCKDTSQGETYHLANASAVGETCLPGCGDLISSICRELAILLSERRESKEAEDNLRHVSVILRQKQYLNSPPSHNLP
jgi:pyridoxal/pyridoxine/pyridoxamine kinase